MRTAWSKVQLHYQPPVRPLDGRDFFIVPQLQITELVTIRQRWVDKDGCDQESVVYVPKPKSVIVSKALERLTDLGVVYTP